MKNPLLLTEVYTGDPLGPASVECIVATRFILLLLFNRLWYVVAIHPGDASTSSMIVTLYTHSKKKNSNLLRFVTGNFMVQHMGNPPWLMCTY